MRVFSSNTEDAPSRTALRKERGSSVFYVFDDTDEVDNSASELRGAALTNSIPVVSDDTHPYYGLRCIPTLLCGVGDICFRNGVFWDISLDKRRNEIVFSRIENQEIIEERQAISVQLTSSPDNEPGDVIR